MLPCRADIRNDHRLAVAANGVLHANQTGCNSHSALQRGSNNEWRVRLGVWLSLEHMHKRALTASCQMLLPNLQQVCQLRVTVGDVGRAAALLGQGLDDAPQAGQRAVDLLGLLQTVPRCVRLLLPLAACMTHALPVRPLVCSHDNSISKHDLLAKSRNLQNLMGCDMHQIVCTKAY